MNARQHAIDDAVDQLDDFCIDLLGGLVRTPSITGNEAPAQERLTQTLRAMNLEVESWSPTRQDVENHPAFCDDGLPLGARPVVVARWRGTEPGKARSLILNGHMDVVPTGDDRAWTGGPWSGDVRDDKLWGRGSCDMKGGLAAGIAAVAALQKAGIQPRGDVLIESVIGEESGGVGTLAAIVKGYRADAALILEPTCLDLCPTGAGALSFRIHVHGRAAHGAMRTEGVSAVAKFYSILKAIEELEHRRQAVHAAPISVGKVMGGDWPSTVPETLIAEGRFGVLPREEVDAARRLFEAAIQEEAAKDDWMASHLPDVEWFEGQFEPGETPADSPILKTLSDSHQDVCARAINVHGVPYGSDLRLFTNHAGMPAVLYGPGDVRVAHSLNEFVPLDEVRRAAKVVARTIADWCA